MSLNILTGQKGKKLAVLNQKAPSDILKLEKEQKIEYRTILGKKLHKEDGPALLEYNEEGELIKESWYLSGERHREDGPAVSIYEGGKINRIEYWENNEMHRSTGPAVEEKKDERGFSNERWYYKGLLHRENAAALLEKNNRVHMEIWAIHGEKHRLNGPAYIHQIDDALKQEWFINGKTHRDDDLPAFEYYGYLKEIKHWYKNGQPHRENNPAFIKKWFDKDDPSRVKHYQEEWFERGKVHKENAPAKINLHNLNTDEEKITLVWLNQGKLHREKGPSLVEYGQETNKEEWYLNGELHREEGPSKIIQTGDNFEIAWHQNGLFHNTEGPAFVYKHNGRITYDYYYSGLRLSSTDINEIRKKESDIKLRQELEKLKDVSTFFSSTLKDWQHVIELKEKLQLENE